MPHNFGRPRPSKSAGFSLHTDAGQAQRDAHFHSLPPATGVPPYHLQLADILPAAQIQAIIQAQKLIFHVNGDVGGIKNSIPQTLVAKGMEADFNVCPQLADTPAFLYILGDCVYDNGEVKSYYAQFYHPYEFYPAPIFAIPGNHDGNNLPDDTTLNGFMRNFCATKPELTPESDDSKRTAMTQPYVYWVLRTPMLNIIGLYSNVPAGGDIREPQFSWLVQQLRELPTTLPLFLMLHHPIYSADEHHSGSTHMKHLLEAAFTQADRMPDMIFSGHVHSYQRLSKILPADRILPYIISGAGGYPDLHQIRKVNGETMITPVQFCDINGDAIVLERYADDHHGFLRLEIHAHVIIGRYYIVPRPQDAHSKSNKLVDYFEYDWRERRYLFNSL